MSSSAVCPEWGAPLSPGAAQGLCAACLMLGAAEPRVDAIVKQALEKERERRQRSAGEIRTQVETLAHPNALPAMKPSRSRWKRALQVAAVLILLIGAGLLVADLLLPQVYYAQVTMEVKRDPGGFWAGEQMVDPTFVPFQFQILRKKKSLEPVIKELHLVDKWSGEGGRKLPVETVYHRLLGMLDLREVRGTGLMEIGVYSTDPQEAADIANSLAVVFRNAKISLLLARIEQGFTQLKDEVEKQRVRTDVALAEMEDIRKRENIVDPRPDSFGGNADVGGPIRVDPDASVNSNPAINKYVEAKARYLRARLILEAAQAKLSTELLDKGVHFDPAKIWELAVPPTEPLRFSFWRLRLAFGP